MLFNYKAIDTDGNRKDGKIDAPDKDAAINALQRRDLVITNLEEAETSEGGGSGLGFSKEITWFERITQKDVVVLSRQMATLFGAQVSALQIFNILASEVEKTTLSRVLHEVADDLQGGSTISDALAKHPDVFSPFYVNMVKSGEESGQLDETFEYLADYLDRMYEINSKARNALIYPTFVIIVFILVMGLMFTFVIPQISTVLEGLNQELPIYTKIVLGISSFFASYWVFVLAVLVVLGIVGWKYIQTPTGKNVFDRFKLNIPYIGTLFQNLILARFAANMNTMLSSGIPMIRALEITRDIVSNSVYKEILTDAIEDVKAGSSLSAALAQYDVMPGVMIQMIKVGEETGELGSLLQTLADFYEREVEGAIDTLVDMIEPAMIVALGIGVGILLASVLMPIYNLASGF